MSQESESSLNRANAPKYPDHVFLKALDEKGPAGTSEVASLVGCTRRGADIRLRELSKLGEIKKSKVGNSLLWSIDEDESTNTGISEYFSNYMSQNQNLNTNPKKGMVITIRKPHSRAILSGEKSIEFRRTQIDTADIPSIGFIYEPKPTKAIVSAFTIQSIKQHPVDHLVDLGAEKTPSTKESLREYYSGKEFGTAIYIDEVHPIDPHIPLMEDDNGDWIFNPPQDFYYVDPVKFASKIDNHYVKSESPPVESHELGEFLETP
jgi:predicted transcriptional regulator